MRVAGLALVMLIGCGGGADSTAIGTLGPGQFLTLSSGQSVMVPNGTLVHTPAQNTIGVNGNNTSIQVPPGSQVIVPLSASGPADNTVQAL